MPTQIIDLCGQELCANEAAFSFLWPGRPRAFICAAHYDKLVAIATTLGLSVESLDVRPYKPSEEQIAALLDQAVEDGELEAHVDEHGKRAYRMTDKGRRRVEALLAQKGPPR